MYLTPHSCPMMCITSNSTPKLAKKKRKRSPHRPRPRPRGTHRSTSFRWQPPVRDNRRGVRTAQAGSRAVLAPQPAAPCYTRRRPRERLTPPPVRAPNAAARESLPAVGRHHARSPPTATTRGRCRPRCSCVRRQVPCTRPYPAPRSTASCSYQASADRAPHSCTRIRRKKFQGISIAHNG